MLTKLQRAASVLRRIAGQSYVPVSERVEWAQHEIASLLRHLDTTDDHLGRLVLVWPDAHQEIELDARLEVEHKRLIARSDRNLGPAP